tara:strand:+ start:682 stop:1191 length:510 start_codon:yes stop_codon:yes gene_type:complete
MIHINIGSNLSSKFGSKLDNITIAINLLIESNVFIKKISDFYETPSYPNTNFPKFLNIGILAETKKNYLELFKITKLIELKLGRTRTQKNNPRIIDIDIIDFKKKIKKTNQIILPHPRCHLRNFVLFPILEIDPKWSHPLLKKNAQFLINNLSQKSRIEITRLKKNVNI